jgi:peptidoglycan/LPS O-acetylase OafA/YrhL
VRGVDSIRWIAALWVVLGHQHRFSVVSEGARHHLAGWALQSLFNNAFNGPAAVIIFFCHLRILHPLPEPATASPDSSIFN